jgi:hypothetical protein
VSHARDAQEAALNGTPADRLAITIDSRAYRAVQRDRADPGKPSQEDLDILQAGNLPRGALEPESPPITMDDGL